MELSFTNIIIRCLFILSSLKDGNGIAKIGYINVVQPHLSVCRFNPPLACRLSGKRGPPSPRRLPGTFSTWLKGPRREAKEVGAVLNNLHTNFFRSGLLYLILFSSILRISKAKILRNSFREYSVPLTAHLLGYSGSVHEASDFNVVEFPSWGLFEAGRIWVAGLSIFST